VHERTDSLSPYYPFHVTAAAATATPLGSNVSTTSATTITAGTDRVVTPASLTNIVSQLRLNFSGGTGAAEDVVVKTVNAVAGTFTADFVNGHSGAYNIISFRPQYLGTLVVNAVTNLTGISIYNGSPLLYAGGAGLGTLIASIGTPPSGTPPYLYNCYCNRGVFYTLTSSGVVSVTFMVTDDNIL